MSSRRVAKLDEKCLRAEHEPLSDPYADMLIPQAFERMRDAGYPLEDILTRYTNVTVKEDENSGYLVYEIETLTHPLDVADASEDRTTMWLCTCPGWLFHHNEGFPKEVRPAGVTDCDHVTKCKRKERQAIDDENQTNLEDL